MATPDAPPEPTAPRPVEHSAVEPDELPAGQAPRHVRRPRLFRPFRAGLYLLYGLIVAWLFVSITSSWVRSIWGDADDPVRSHAVAAPEPAAPNSSPPSTTTAHATER